jgi:hypothetical protein
VIICLSIFVGSQGINYYCFTVTEALQESRGAPQYPGVVELSSPELLFQNLFGFFALVAAGEGFF